MKFGKVPAAELEHVNFNLPADPAVTTRALAKGSGNTKFYIGCAKWGHKDWIGNLYPKGTKEKDFLEYYARLFNCIEFNATFYKSPSASDVLRWQGKVQQGFKFFPKFPQTITHLKRLKSVRGEVDTFLDSIVSFGDNLGPIFLMPHPQMGIKHMDTIMEFIADFPQDVPMFLELRHEDYYTDIYNKDLYQFLAKQKRGTVITDAPGRRDCVHMHLSTPECFIRFVGNSLHTTDYERIDDWVQRIKQWMAQGLESCYFFMHQHGELQSPELIKYLMEQLNKHCGTRLTPPNLDPPKIHYESTLFD